MVFAAINGVQWAAYHARQQFLWAEFSPVLASLLVFFLLVWALPRYGVIAAAWLSALRMGLQTLLLLPGISWPVRVNLNSDAINEAWRRIKPLLAGTAYYKTDPLVDRFLLSMAGSGSLSLYYLAQQIYGAVNQVLNKAVAAPMVPVLSMLHKAGGTADLQHIYHRKLLHVGLISLSGLLMLVLFGETLLKLLVGYGNVDAEKIGELWWIMLWLGGLFIGGSVGQVSSSAFYAIGDTRTPTRLSIASYTVYIPSKVGAFYFGGVFGLAVATSVYYMINLLVQVWVLEWRWRRDHGY
jgi:putative peptidoglycan lipid II flippase